MRPGFLLLLFGLGLWVGHVLRPQSFQAAPPEVLGSGNVAVDVYQNQRGTFVLWSNGRLTLARGGAGDLGHPYRTPDASAQIGSPPLEQGKSLGSEHVAVKALVRPEASYVVFADGAIRLPANSDAAAGAASPESGLRAGCWINGASEDPGKYTVSVVGNELRVQFSEAIDGSYSAWAAGGNNNGDLIPYSPISGRDGTNLVFHQQRGLNDPSPNGYFFVVVDD
jgi:hypothetical protein